MCRSTQKRENGLDSNSLKSRQLNTKQVSARQPPRISLHDGVRNWRALPGAPHQPAVPACALPSPDPRSAAAHAQHHTPPHASPNTCVTFSMRVHTTGDVKRSSSTHHSSNKQKALVLLVRAPPCAPRTDCTPTRRLSFGWLCLNTVGVEAGVRVRLLRQNTDHYTHLTLLCTHTAGTTASCT